MADETEVPAQPETQVETPELSTTEKALDFWEKSEAAYPPESKPEGTVETGSPTEVKPEETAAQIPDEQLQADPRYKEVAEFRDAVQPVLEQHGIPDAKELGLQLADSAILYQIARGEAPAEKLLDTMVQAGYWGKERVDNVAQGLIDWLSKNGYLKGGEGQQPEPGKGPQLVDPLDARLKGVEETLAQQRQQAEQAATQQYQQKVFDAFRTKVGELCEAKGIDKEDLDFYGAAIRQAMPADQFKAIIARIEKGNFVDVQRLFDQVHAAESKRAQRYADNLAKSAEHKQKTTPRVPTGGSPPAPKGQPKPKLSNYEERIKAANEAWDSA